LALPSLSAAPASAVKAAEKMKGKAIFLATAPGAFVLRPSVVRLQIVTRQRRVTVL
jgi:hypothetical protein